MTDLDTLTDALRDEAVQRSAAARRSAGIPSAASPPAPLSDEASGAGDHPDPATLVAYLADELGAEQEDSIRAHLVACAECASTVLDLHSLEPGLPSPESEAQARTGDGAEVVDLGKVAAWRELEARLSLERDSAADPQRTVAQVGGPVGARARGRTPAGAPWSRFAGLAAMLAIVVLSLSVVRLLDRAGQLESRLAELEAPQANQLLYYLEPQKRSTVPEFETVVLGPEHRTWVLVLTPPPTALGAGSGTLDGGFERYRVQIVDARGQVDTLSDSLKLNEHGTLRLGLGRREIQPGEYLLRLLGIPGQPGSNQPGSSQPGSIAGGNSDASDDGSGVEGVVLEERAIRIVWP